jgi:acyl-CoA thioester hydrolase
MNDGGGHLEGFPVVVPNRVLWGEMDAYQHVNNVVFFRYFENARIEYLSRTGFTDREALGGIGPILHSTRARFRLPLQHPDMAWAGARTVEIQEDRIVMEYRVVSERHGAVAADGGGIVVAFDYRASAKVPIPQPVRAAIERLEGR